jgi:uncharacterized protein (TIGR02996 family)
MLQGDVAALEHYIGWVDEDYRDLLLYGDHSEGKHLWAVVCEPDGGAADPEEDAFLEQIRERPSDNALRLVYADWLEERGDVRAEYVRVLCAWLTCAAAEEQALIERERELRATLSRRWLAQVRGMAVREKKKRRKGR